MHSGTLIFMRNVPGKPHYRALILPLKCQRMDGVWEDIPIDFEWDGSSVPVIFQGIFPRHRHPIASCRHDYRCRNARTWQERLFADKEFAKDVRKTSWWLTKSIGYAGVRIGAYLGAGWYKNEQA